MREDLGLTEVEFTVKTKAATDALLRKLQRHHAFDVPEKTADPLRALLTVKIAEQEPVSEPVEVCVLPVVEGRLTIEAIKRVVCKHFEVSHTDLVSSRRHHKVTLPRMIAMYLSRELTVCSLPMIGRQFGGRDHTTVLHSVRKIEELVESKGFCSRDVTYLREHLCA